MDSKSNLTPQMRELHERIIRLTTEIIIHRPERKIIKRWVKDFEQWSKDALAVKDEPPFTPEQDARYARAMGKVTTVEDEPSYKHLERAIEHSDTVNYEFRGYDKDGNPTEAYTSIGVIEVESKVCKCGGDMVWTSIFTTDWPTGYAWKCPDCGRVEVELSTTVSSVALSSRENHQGSTVLLSALGHPKTDKRTMYLLTATEKRN